MCGDGGAGECQVLASTDDALVGQSSIRHDRMRVFLCSSNLRRHRRRRRSARFQPPLPITLVTGAFRIFFWCTLYTPTPGRFPACCNVTSRFIFHTRYITIRIPTCLYNITLIVLKQNF